MILMQEDRKEVSLLHWLSRFPELYFYLSPLWAKRSISSSCYNVRTHPLYAMQSLHMVLMWKCRICCVLAGTQEAEGQKLLVGNTSVALHHLCPRLDVTFCGMEVCPRQAWEKKSQNLSTTYWCTDSSSTPIKIPPNFLKPDCWHDYVCICRDYFALWLAT